MKLNAASRKTESGHVGTGQKPKKESPYESAQDVSKPPSGRKGNSATREQNQEIGEHVEQTTGATQTGGGTLPETHFPPTGGGTTWGRFADVVNTGPDGKRIITNTVDTNASGGLTTRETGAAVDIIERMKPGEIVQAVPKVKPPKD
jgi:hypothetical protein